MKRRQRRPILDIDGEHSNSPVRFSQEKYKQSTNSVPGENGSNPLKGLLGQYNSDSETEDVQQTANKLDDKVNDFLKEIQLIAPENPALLPKDIKGKSYSTQPEMPWQECFDESTGYPYYWHTNTNQVTWEMPPEYRLWKEKKQMTVNQHNLHVSHWPSVSSNSEIPEGMIPKEVVARNRNRQAGIQENRVPVNTKQLDTSLPPHLREDDSDDGKIEMITSFGNEESEESESDSHVEEPSESILKKVNSRKHSKYSNKEKKIEVKPTNQSIEIGPSLPPEMQEKISGSNSSAFSSTIENFLKTKSSVPSTINSEPNGTEEDILRRLKNQAKLLQSMNEKSDSNSRGGSPFETEYNKINESEKRLEDKSQTHRELKVSLVPGYEDDSDIEEEIPSATDVKPLFPIVEYQTEKPPISTVSDGILKKVETRQTESGCIRIFEYRNVDTDKSDTDNEIKELNKEIESVDNELESRVTQPAQDVVKVNKFLENLETPTKAFQRKKRIAFDVLPNRPKVVETQEVTTTEEVQAASTVSESDRFGIGFQKEKEKEKEEVNDSETVEVKPAEVSAKTEKELISFVKGETMNNSTKPVEEVKSIPAAENKEFKYLTEMISEKLKFLSEGCQTASAVQIMAIQLQTLLEAWESGDLKQTYLYQWLTTTGRELSRLEQTAAPPGWECQWDRYGILTDSITSPNTPSFYFFVSQNYPIPLASLIFVN